MDTSTTNSACESRVMEFCIVLRCNPDDVRATDVELIAYRGGPGVMRGRVLATLGCRQAAAAYAEREAERRSGGNAMWGVRPGYVALGDESERAGNSAWTW